MVDFFNLDDVNDRDWDVNIDRDVDIVYFVKAERGDFLVVVLLVLKKDQGNSPTSTLVDKVSWGTWLDFAHLHE